MSNTEREEVFKDITRQASREQTIVANERSGYRMPPEYITRKTLVQIDLACTVICSEAQEDPRYFLNRFQGDSMNLAMNLTFAIGFSLWLKNSSLLYCVTEELAKALIETDILDKKNILTDLTWQFQQIVVAIPRFLLCPPGTTDVYVDFLLVNCFKKPGIETQWISICFVDTSGNIWVADTQIDADGDVIIDHGKLDEKDREFCDKIRSFAINILLLLETSGGSLVSDVVPTETVDDVKQPKGFGKKSLTPPPKYPRWIGKNYQIKSEQSPVSESRGTHASPRIHWRRGHWRCIEPGEGKKWKQSKRLWIEPVLINASIE